MSTYYQTKFSEMEAVTDDFYFITDITPALQLSVTGAWDTTLQYQYDIIMEKLYQMQQSQPLKKDNILLRAYDYVEYYTGKNGPSEDFSYWWNHWANLPYYKDVGIPFDVRNMNEATARNFLASRIELCMGLKPILKRYRDGLRWNLIVEDNRGGRTSAVLQPGGWFKNSALDYSFKFVSDKEHIGHDDLAQVIMITEVKEWQDME